MRIKIFQNEQFLVWVILVVLTLIWGSSFILIKKGLEVFTPVQVGTARIAFAFLALLPYAIPNLKKIPLKRWKVMIVIGFLGNLIPAYLFSIAETELKSSLTGILNALTPVFTFIIAVFFFRHKVKWMQILGLLLAFAGSLGLSFVNESGGLGSMNFYVWFVVLATLLYAVSLNLIKHYFNDTNAILLSALAMFSVGPAAMIILFSTDFISRLQNAPGAFESLFYIAILGLAGTAFALILYNKLIRITTAVMASSVTYLIPFVAVLWGLLDGESLYMLHYTGLIITIIGIYIVNKSK
ncbi:MAG TPA: DMT family transporter [Ignavibacteria bacterium]